MREPRTVLREFGTELPEDMAVHVHDSTADLRHAKLLATLVSRHCSKDLIRSVLSWLVLPLWHCRCML